jgi:5-methylthioadenosine/S-adenosylhomocysteine deaminase
MTLGSVISVLALSGFTSSALGQANPERTLIRGAALVITMDPTLGTGPLGLIQNADVLIEGDHIVAVGPDLSPHHAEVVDARGKIVMPGFVDTHDHLWQTVIRGCEADEAFGGWAAGCTNPILNEKIHHEDAEAFVRLGALATLATGTTTILENSHAPTMAFADGTMDALEASGQRFVLAYRFRVGREQHVRDIYTNRILPNPLANFEVGGPVPSRSPAALADLTAAITIARELTTKVNIHILETAGDRANNPVSVLQDVGAFTDFDGRLVLNHLIHTTDAELDLMAAHGAAATHNPMSNMRLASGVMRLPDIHARHMKVGLGFDGGTADTPDMFETMRSAIGLQRATTHNPKIFPGVEDVLRMATLGGAEVLGLQDQIGSLTPGKKADIIIINPNDANFAPRVDWVNQIVFNGQPGNVEWVFVNGNTLMKKGKFVGADEQAILEEAQAARDRVMARL